MRKAIVTFFLTTLVMGLQAQTLDKPVYLDESKDIETRVEDAL